MATVEELLRAAKNADAAGDTEAARKLVLAAKDLMAPAPKYREENMAAAQEPPPAYDGVSAVATQPRANRFGDIIGEATEAPLAMTKAFGAGLADQSQSPTMRALPADWNPRVRGMVAGLGDLGGAAIGALGTGFAVGAGAVGEAIGSTPTQERKLARDLMMMGEVAAPELAGVSGTVLATGRAVQGAESLSRPATAAQEAARAAGDLGITPSLGMGGKVRGMTAATLEKTPIVAERIAMDAERAVGEVEGVFSRIAGGIGRSLGSEAAGSALQGGLQGFADGFKKTSEKLFGVVDQRIPGDARFQAGATAQRIAESKAAFENNPELSRMLGLNRWDAVVAEAGENGLTWSALKQFRSKVGEAIGAMESGRQGGALGGEDLGRLKSLYGALTQDMTLAAQSVGEDAFAAWQRANSHYRAGRERFERSLDATINVDNPERAFEAFSALLQRDRSSSDIKRVRDIKASLGEEDWRTVSASIVGRLGRATAGQQNAAGDAFSPSVFLTNWNRMDPEARRLLLPEEARLELEKLAKVAESVKVSNVERNASNTGTVVAAGAIGSAFTQAPIATLLTTGGTYLSVRAMTSVPYLKALNSAARGDQKALNAMANGNGPFAVDARTILQMTAAEAAQGDPANSPTSPLRAVTQPR
jgi:hypothetical protein